MTAPATASTVLPQITVRRIPFEFSDQIAPLWQPTQPEWSHMVNGASLAMPYLEPFLIKNVREALTHIDDATLADAVRAFVGQEAAHYTNHRRYNEMLKRNGYPELAEVEAEMAADFKRLERRSLRWRLAYTAGFETMTIGLTQWLIEDREALFSGADPTVASLILWHMVEETEHKTVAFDVYQRLFGDYFARVRGLSYAAWHVAAYSRRAYVRMLKRDGLWRSIRSRMRLWRMVGRFYRNVAPALLHSLAPNHHPSTVHDPTWVGQWREAYAASAADTVPMLDTRAPGLPARFRSPPAIPPASSAQRESGTHW
jgi:predicted metal-dependent hydrolase